MKVLTKLSLFLLAGIGIVATGCKDPDKDNPQSQVTVNLALPEGTTGELSDVTCNFTNLNTTAKTSVTEFVANSAIVTLDKGAYSVEVSGKLDGYTYVGLSENISIMEDNQTVGIQMSLGKISGDLVIAEIFFTGTTTPENEQYSGDQYIRLYNNSDDTVYADGVAILESAFMTVDDYTYTPDIMSEYFSADAVYVIPGDGDDYPVAPRSSLIICDQALDHREANPNSFDLSGADFEWYDDSPNPNFLDTDNPDVPNLDKWYSYTATVWSLHNRGFRSYAIARMETSKEEFLANNFYTYNYELVVPGFDPFPMDGDAYKVPNEWILDAVNLSISSMFQQICTDPSLDRGWTHCGEQDHDENRYNKSVMRKSDSQNKFILTDTNNSTEDFEADAVPFFLR